MIEDALLDGVGLRYLCEYIYYRSMHVLGVPAIFVHVPPVDSPYDMEELLSAMKHVIARTVEEVCGNTVVPDLLIGHGHLDQWVVKFTDLVSGARAKQALWRGILSVHTRPPAQGEQWDGDSGCSD